MEMVHFIPPRQRRVALLASQADTAPVLICGGPGTGKEVIAQWIHQNGPRSAHTFVQSVENQPLVEQIVAAQGGTLVVSEIGNLPLGEQKVLLKYLNTKTVPHPDHNGTEMLCNSRIIATTSQKLEGRAQGGLFNLELLKKLNIFRIEMPDLSDRTEEMEDIAQGILSEITRELHKDHLRKISPEAWKKFQEYHWPGNLRELRNVLRVAVSRARGDQIEASDLPDFSQEMVDFRKKREEFERVYLLELLKTFDWKIDRACEVNRIDKTALLKKINKYGIDVSGGPHQEHP